MLLACAGFTGGIDAGPFDPWRSVTNTTLCVQPSNTTNGTPLAVRPCDPTNPLQLWSWLRDGNTIYRLQNGGTPNACAGIDDGGHFNGQTVKLGDCTLLESSVNAVSNVQWDSVTPLPNVVQLKSLFHFTPTGCIDIIDSNLIVEVCNPSSLSQKWIVGVS